MAGSLLSTPTFALQPAAEQVALQTNYITNFNFLNQYLPDTYEKEFERYGNRTIASFLRMVGAEMPSNSDQIKWAEQGRLHIKYTNCTSAAAINSNTATFTVADSGVTYIAIRVGQTVMIQNNTTGVFNKAIVTSVPSATTFAVAYYEASGQAFAVSTQCTVFIYGSEFKKGTNGMVGSLESEDDIYSNNPIIIKDKYAVNGSDMAQIGWVEVTTENGATGYLWYLKSEHETRLRFEDYLETSMIEAVPAASSSGAATAGYIGSEGIFYVVNNRGNVWGGGTPTTLSDWDSIVSRLDKQGAIEENVVFVNRGLSFDIDNMLATLNGYTSGGVAQSASFGLFDNDVDMALNLGFTGFPFLSGFFSKDEILMSAFAHNPLVFGLALVSAGITGFYMFRMFFVTFHGTYRNTHHGYDKVHESPLLMTLPLLVLAVLSVIGGAVNLPHYLGDSISGGLHHLLSYDGGGQFSPILMYPEHAIELSHTAEIGLLVMAVSVFVIAFLYTRNKYVTQGAVPESDEAQAGMGKVLANKFYVDEAYDTAFVSPIEAAGDVVGNYVDDKGVKGFVDGFGSGSNFISRLLSKIQNGNIEYYLVYMVIGIALLLAFNLF